METWFKVPNGIVDDPLNVGLSDAAWTLWLHGMCYCSANLTDGFIPEAILPRLSGVKNPTRAAGELVAVGLWTPVDGGWRISGYEDEQQTRAGVEKVREQARERQRKKREAERRGVTEGSRRDTSVTNAEVTDESQRTNRDVRVPDTDTDTDTDTDMTTTSRLTGLSNAPVENSDDDWINSHAKQHLAAHIAFRSNQIDKPKALARSQLPKIIDTIRDELATGADRFDIDDILEREWPTIDHAFNPQPSAAVRRVQTAARALKVVS